MQSPLETSRIVLQDACRRADQYLDEIGMRRVAPSPESRSKLSAFDAPMPHEPGDPASTIALLDEVGSPATTATVGGRFFGLVVGGTLPAPLGARALASAWDQIVFNDVTSPVGTKLEKVASKWVLDILGPARNIFGRFCYRGNNGQLHLPGGGTKHIAGTSGMGRRKNGALGRTPCAYRR